MRSSVCDIIGASRVADQVAPTSQEHTGHQDDF